MRGYEIPKMSIEEREANKLDPNRTTYAFLYNADANKFVINRSELEKDPTMNYNKYHTESDNTDNEYYANITAVPTFYNRYDSHVQDWYENRNGAIYYANKTRESDIFKAWQIALINLENYKSTDEIETELVKCWKSILKSSVAYLILARGFTANKIFDRFMTTLLRFKKMKEFFATILYPISFLFTPNMTGHKRLIFIDIGKKTKAKMHKVFVQTYKQHETYLPNQNILTWYLGKEGRNETLEMIGYDIFEKDPILTQKDLEDKEKKKAKSKADAEKRLAKTRELAKMFKEKGTTLDDDSDSSSSVDEN